MLPLFFIILQVDQKVPLSLHSSIRQAKLSEYPIITQDHFNYSYKDLIQTPYIFLRIEQRPQLCDTE